MRVAKRLQMWKRSQMWKSAITNVKWLNVSSELSWYWWSGSANSFGTVTPKLFNHSTSKFAWNQRIRLYRGCGMLTKGFILFNLKQRVLKYFPFFLHNWDNIWCFFLCVYELNLRVMPHTITKNIFTFAIFCFWILKKNTLTFVFWETGHGKLIHNVRLETPRSPKIALLSDFRQI